MISWLKKAPRIQVVADFGAVSPTVLAFRIHKKDKQLLFVERESLRVPHSLEGPELFRASLGALADFTDGLERQTGDKVKNILVALPNDAVIRSVSRQVRVIRPHPNLPVSREELKALWKRISDPEIMRQFIDSETLKRYEPLSNEFESIELDGYPLKNAYGSAGKELSISFVATFWPHSYQAYVANIRPMMHSSVLDFIPRTEALRAYFLFRGGSDVSGILLDIGWDDSLILVFREGGIVASRIFPFGASNIIRSIGEHFRLTAHDSKVLYGQWVRGEVDADVARQLEKVSTRAIRLWKREFMFFLASIAKRCVLKPDIHCSGWGATLPTLEAELAESEWRERWSSSEGSTSMLFPREQESRIFGGDSIFKTPGDSVLFALVLRMMQRGIK